MNKKIGFVLFEDFWQRKNIGSSRIRGQWLINHMSDAERFVQGKNYETVIYQKTYWKEHARAFQGKKILDICDPDWLDGAEVVSFIHEVDAVTTSTERLQDEIKKFTDNPVYYIMDREDLSNLPSPKVHTAKKATRVAWFGYIGNAHVLDNTLAKIKRLGLTLVVISDGTYASGECPVENIKYDPETVNENLLSCDLCLLPDALTGRGAYKSQNKTHHAWGLGFPVAKTAVDLEKFVRDSSEREKEGREKRKWVIENCNVKKSVDELRAVIDAIKK